MGPVAAQFLRGLQPTIDTLDATSACRMWEGLKIPLSRLRGQRPAEVMYVGHSGDSPRARALKLLLCRTLAGASAPVRGFGYFPALDSLPAPTTGASRWTRHQALVPFHRASESIRISRSSLLRFLAPTEDELSNVDSIIRSFSIAGVPPPIGVYVGSRVSRKRWPLERWRSLITALQADGFPIVLLGGAEDEPTNQAMLCMIAQRACSAAAQTTLRESIWLSQRLGLVIANDGAAAHLAALAGTPVVSIFCNWEPAGAWEPVLAPSSRSIRPVWSLRDATKDEYGISSIPVPPVLAAARALLDGGSGHSVITVTADGMRHEESIAGFPFVPSEPSVP